MARSRTLPRVYAFVGSDGQPLTEPSASISLGSTVGTVSLRHEVDSPQDWTSITGMQTTPLHNVAHKGGGNFEVDGQNFVIGIAAHDARGLHHSVINVYGQRAATFDYMDTHWYVSFNYSIAHGALAPAAAAALFDAWRAYGFPTER